MSKMFLGARKQRDATVVFAFSPVSFSFIEWQDNSFIPVFRYRAIRPTRLK